MTQSGSDAERIAVARRTFAFPASQVYAALTQMLDYSIGFDIVERQDGNRSVLFSIPGSTGVFEARVMQDDDVSSAVSIAVPFGTGDMSTQCERLYRELDEQLHAQAAPQPNLMHERFVRSLMLDNSGPRSKLAIAAIIVSIIILFAGLGQFDAWRPNWSGATGAALITLGLSVAAVWVTGPRGKVSGRKLALAALTVSILAVVLMLIAMLVVQLRYSFG